MGNREIFLYDYAQRRIFQITDTKSILKPRESIATRPDSYAKSEWPVHADCNSTPDSGRLITAPSRSD